jgi:hypothetical protein
LVIADLRVTIAFDFLIVAAMSGQYSEWFARFNIGPVGSSLQCRVRGCDARFLVEIAMMYVFFTRGHRWQRRSGVCWCWHGQS